MADEVKSSTVKFSEDEMTKLQELQNSYQQKQVEFGQLRVQRIILNQQSNALEEKEKQIEQEYVNVQQEEQQLVNELNEKYGPGSLDPQTGEFTPVVATETESA